MKGMFICMPLKENIPEPKNPDWKLTNCEICGAECWESEIAEKILKHGAIKSCTKCALAATMKKKV